MLRIPVVTALAVATAAALLASRGTAPDPENAPASGAQEAAGTGPVPGVTARRRLMAEPELETVPSGAVGSPSGTPFNPPPAPTTLAKWHTLTLDFSGSFTGESATPNPFTDKRLDVTFVSPGRKLYVVPGFFAADGDAAETGATSGSTWRARFTPDREGLWTWTARFLVGPDVATATEPQVVGVPAEFDGASGTLRRRRRPTGARRTPPPRSRGSCSCTPLPRLVAR